MKAIDYKNLSFIVATHIFSTGPGQDLREFLVKQRSKRLLFIGHPLYADRRLNDSGYEYYEEGVLQTKYYKALQKEKIDLRDYVFHGMKTLYWAFSYNKRWDLFVGCSNANAFFGILLKWLGKVDKTIYYVVDYNPYRFKNKFLNSFYHFVDQFCVTHSDETWNLSPRMAEGRREYFNFQSNKQKTLPLGVWTARMRVDSMAKVDPTKFVFMGHIIKKQGIQKLIKIIPDLIQKIPKFKLIIIGEGDYLPTLKSMVKELNVGKHVDFKGYIEDAKEVESTLSSCAAAFALYDKYDEDGHLTFTYFSDPGKIKLYIACGLYVFTTDVSYNVQELSSRKLCKIVEDIKGDIISSATGKDWKDTLNLSRKEAVKFSTEINWDDIFKNALCDILKQ